MSYRPQQTSNNFFTGASLSNAVRMLIAWNVIVFLLQLILRSGGELVLRQYLFQGRMEMLFSLVPEFVRHGEVWRLVTYMFLHDGIFHIGLNMLALWMFGSELEYLWGTKRFIGYYFFTGIGAGICTTLFTSHPTIGASGAVYGLLLAFGMTFPNRPILLYFILPIQAKYFVMIFGALEFLRAVFDQGSGIAHVAHLGGLVFGYVYIKGWPGRKAFQRWKRERQKRKFKVLDFRDPDQRN